MTAGRSSAFAGRRVLVTGHTGFKGAWLSLWLQRLGAEVMGYALPPPTDPSLFELAKLARRLDHVVGDVRDLDALLTAFDRHAPEVVFHLAAQPLVLRSYREPKETFDTNVGGTVNVLEAVRRTPSVKAVVVVTSDKCYENREWVFGYREDDAMGGHDPYSASKGAAELVTAAYRRSFFAPDASTRVVGLASARAGNVIGGGDFADDRILPDALRAVQAGKPLLVRNPGSTRPWQHVLDPLAGYLLLATRLLDDPGRYAEAFNFGPDLSGVSSVRELVTSFYASLGDGRFVSPSRATRRARSSAGSRGSTR
jgi:CDP-glucose 4,6-dehydratase